MPITAAPALTAAQASALLAGTSGVAVLDLTSSRVFIDQAPADEVWESPQMLVLATSADAVHAAGVAARAAGVLGGRSFLDALVDVLNADLAALAAAGEIPTADEVAAVLAELEHFDAEVIDLFAARGGAA